MRTVTLTCSLCPPTAFQTEGKLYLILDFLRGGDLFTRLSKEVMSLLGGHRLLASVWDSRDKEGQKTEWKGGVWVIMGRYIEGVCVCVRSYTCCTGKNSVLESC